MATSSARFAMRINFHGSDNYHKIHKKLFENLYTYDNSLYKHKEFVINYAFTTTACTPFSNEGAELRFLLLVSEKKKN